MMKLNEAKESIIRKWDWSNNTDYGPIGAIVLGLLLAPVLLVIGYFFIDFLARIVK
jgi:hypothetical protein